MTVVEELMRHSKIAEPCTANWDEMTGDEKTRFCGQCKLNVHNARMMTDEEVLEKLMMTASGERVCMRIYRRQDGTFLTKNCPIGVRKLQERVRRAAAFLAGGLSLLLSLAANAQSKDTKGNTTDKKPVWHSQVTADAPSDQQPKPKPSGWLQILPNVPKAQPANYAGGISAQPCYTDEQVQTAQQEAEQLEKRVGAESPQLADKLQELGMMYYWQRKYPEAERTYKKALAIYDKTNNYSGARYCCIQLGVICRIRKDEAGSAEWAKRTEALTAAMTPAKQVKKP